MMEDPVVGCSECSGHMRAWLSSHPVSGDPRKWSHGFHNAVNARLGKPQLTFERASVIHAWR
jgi:hypothetical protein